MNTFAKKTVIFFIISCMAFTYLQAQPAPGLNQRDIDQFLEFADDYIKMAKRFVNPKNEKAVSDYFYSDNNKLLTASSNFLKKKRWTYEKMNDFLYIVGTGMEAIAFYDEYGYPEEVGQSDDDPFKDIPKKTLDLIKKNKHALKPYFPPMSLDDFPEYDDYSDFEIEDDDDGEYEDEEDDLTEEDIIVEEEVKEVKEIKEPGRKKIRLDRSAEGKYKMDIEGDTHYGYSDYIEIKHVSADSVTGTVQVDWGIGAESRQPMDWEIMYTKSFNAKRSGDVFQFTVIIGAGKTDFVTKYRFTLYPVKDKRGNIAIEGKLKIIEINYDDKVTDCKVKAEK